MQKVLESEALIRQALDCMGLDRMADAEKTPARFIRYLQEFSQPLDLQKIFGSSFDNKEFSYGTVVLQANIPFRMICSHHLLPALGRAAVGYIPNRKVIGLSKLTRLVQGVGTETPTLQEYATRRVVELLDGHLEPWGSMAVISAEHTCMACRGINRDRVETVTSQTTGEFFNSAERRTEFFELCKYGNSTK